MRVPRRLVRAAVAGACWLTATAGWAGGEWVNAYAKGLQLAREQKRLLLVDFSAEWCGWCRKMDQDVYVNEQVLAALREFVCVKVDVDRDTRTAAAFQIGSLPRTMVIAPGGRIAGDRLGYTPPGEFVTFLAEARAAAAKPEGLTPAPGLESTRDVEAARTMAVTQTQAQAFSPGFLGCLGHAEPEVRAEARRRVKEGGAGFVPHLVTALGHEDLGVRIAAWQSLKEIARPRTAFDPWAPAAERAKTQAAVAAELTPSRDGAKGTNP